VEAQRFKVRHPSWFALVSFAVRAKLLQVRRALHDAIFRLPWLAEGAAADFPFVLAESKTPLYTGYDPREQPLFVGKIENLRLACRQIHCRVLAPGQTFSFWRQVGPPWRSRGFSIGREVREGCVIPTIGGGLCQLSGSLFELASGLNFDLIERHYHTALPADVPYDARRDATLFWNYVDLRFRGAIPVLFECYISEDSLIVRLRGKTPRFHRSNLVEIAGNQVRVPARTLIGSCFTCGEAGCARHRDSIGDAVSERPR
jgi:vancomycin resistance protein YoaR